MFKRRHKPTLAQKLLRSIWPKGGWGRALRYHWHRMRRSPHSPKAVARGFAIGVAIGLTPLIGLHIWIALGLSWLVEASLMAAFVGVAVVGNYVSMLPILALDYYFGRFIFRMIGVEMPLPSGDASFRFLLHHPWQFCQQMVAAPIAFLPLALPTLLGSIVLGAGCYFGLIFFVRDSIQTWRKHRLQLLQKVRR